MGAEMVDWLLAIGSASGIVKSRHQATGMWQALLEEGIIQHGKSTLCINMNYIMSMHKSKLAEVETVEYFYV